MRLRRIFPIVILFCLSFSLEAQDTIYKRNNTKILANVLEISEHHVRYKLHSNPSGPDYLIEKRLISKIVFRNGEAEYFHDVSVPDIYVAPPKSLVNDPSKNVRRNFISTSIVDPFFGNFSIRYERVLNNGMYSLSFPLSLGRQLVAQKDTVFPSELGAYYGPNKVVSVGAEINAYPNGQGQVRGFIAYAVEYFMHKQWEYYYYPWPSNPTPAKIYVNSWAMMFRFGVTARASEQLCFSTNVGMGYVRHDVFTDHIAGNGGRSTFALRIGVNAGYRF